jgi:hypothetical protein
MRSGNNVYYLFRIQNNKHKEIKMSKVMLMGLIDKAKDEIVNKYADGMIEHLQSDEYKEKIATKINKKIDIPFVSEAKEQLFFERIVDLVTDIVEGIIKK